MRDLKGISNQAPGAEYDEIHNLGKWAPLDPAPLEEQHIWLDKALVGFRVYNGELESYSNEYQYPQDPL